MNNHFIILAAGSGDRFNSKMPKQYFLYKNKQIFEHSLEKALNSKLFKKIILVVDNPKKIKKKYHKSVLVIKGGRERSDSSLIALKNIKKFKPTNVFIHDAARPNFSAKLLNNISINLKKNKVVVPFIEPKDSLKYKIKNQIYNLDRDKSMLTQTPQAFRFKELYNFAIREKNKINDEATLFINKNYKIKFIKGENKNNKITYKSDLNISKTFYGIGFDIHKLTKNKKLYLGGARIPFHSGLQGHSDGDVILHAIIDSILGATKKKDIGTYYPSNKNRFKNIRSARMLGPIITNLYKNDFSINNLDINLICQKPKVSKYRNKIINSISKLMKLDKKKINLKGRTVEKLGLIGQEKAIASEVIISITKYD